MRSVWEWLEGRLGWFLWGGFGAFELGVFGFWCFGAFEKVFLESFFDKHRGRNLRIISKNDLGFHSFSQLSCTKGLHMACCHDPKFVVFYINLSHFSWDRSQRRIVLCLSAPKKGQSFHAQLETKVLDSKQVEENKRSAKQRINVFHAPQPWPKNLAVTGEQLQAGD